MSTLLWATAVAATFCGAFLWMGWAGLIIFVAMAVGIFGGLLASSTWGLEFAFSDLRVDVAKCLSVSAVVSGISYALVVHFGGLGASALPICWLVAMKLCWFELTKPALVLTFVTSLSVPAVVAIVILEVLGRR